MVFAAMVWIAAVVSCCFQISFRTRRHLCCLASWSTLQLLLLLLALLRCLLLQLAPQLQRIRPAADVLRCFLCTAFKLLRRHAEAPCAHAAAATLKQQQPLLLLFCCCCCCCCYISLLSIIVISNG
jgi:hypothetical protein